MDLDLSRGLALMRGPGAWASPYILGPEVAAAASGRSPTMATFNPRRFAEADSLKRIDPEILRQFLNRFLPFFSSRGLKVTESPLDYDALAGVLVDRGESTPSELVDALYLVHEMADDDGMQTLLAENEALPAHDRVDFGDSPDLAPADVALRIWLKDPRFLEQVHAEQNVEERRNFEYFGSLEVPTGVFEPPPRSVLVALEGDLGLWFASKKKGDVVRVFVYPKDDGVWILVRHGEAFRREGALKGRESSCVFYRPEKFDVMVFDPATGEIRINAGSKGEKDQYRLCLGRHLFGNDNYFPAVKKKYTLEPLKAGPDSIICSDIQGIDAVRLRELALFWGGGFNDWEIRRSDDIFASMAERERTIQGNAKIMGARFEVRFSNSKTPRSVYVRPPGITKFTRDDDAPLIEDWLARRGFTLPRKVNAHTEDRAPVATA